MHKHKHHFAGCLQDRTCRCEIKRYWILLFVNAITLNVGGVGGWLSNSLAVYSDTLHVAADFAANVLALHIAYKVISSDHRSENMIRAKGGIISSLLLFVALIPITIEAFKRALSPEPLFSGSMILFAVIGLIGNCIAMWLMHQGHEDHDTHVTLAAHIVSDLAQSVGVVLGGILVLVTKIYVIDTVISACIVIFLLRVCYKTMKRSIRSIRSL